jgi:hypothetical protein
LFLECHVFSPGYEETDKKPDTDTEGGQTSSKYIKVKWKNKVDLQRNRSLQHTVRIIFQHKYKSEIDLQNNTIQKLLIQKFKI